MPSLLKDGKWTEIPGKLTREGQAGNLDFDRHAMNAGLWVARIRRHRLFGRSHLPQRIDALRNLGRCLMKVLHHQCCRHSEAIQLSQDAHAERKFLVRLRDYCAQEDPRVDQMLKALSESSAMESKSFSYQKGGRHYTGLTGGHIYERLDPRNALVSDVQKYAFAGNFTAWQRKHADDPTVKGATTWEKLGEYFLRLYDKDQLLGEDERHSDKQRIFDQLEFEGMNLKSVVIQRSFLRRDRKKIVSERRGKALTYYAPKRKSPRELNLHKFNVRKHSNIVPWLAPYQTTETVHGSSQERYVGNVALGRKPRWEEPEQLFAQLFVMQQNEIFVAPAAEVHANPAGFRDVMAAGMIAAERGKIIAIDNKSGHYQPSWQEFRQAVRKISWHGAFEDGALAGLCYTFEAEGLAGGMTVKNIAFLPVADFLQLCNVIGNGKQTLQAWSQMSKRWGRDFPTMPIVQKHERVFSTFVRVWKNANLTWEQMGTDLVRYLHRSG